MRDEMRKSFFDHATGAWKISWPGRVARHDLVYQAPPEDPMQGIPLGNGDIGVLCWCEASSLVMAVNKCDLWDDLGNGEVENWHSEETDDTLRHACRIIIDFQQPVFDLFYRRSFNGRLSLADACLYFDSSSSFGDLKFKLFVDHDSGAVCGEIIAAMQEPVGVNITVEHFGSRTFSHWYSQIRKDPAIGTAGTEAFAAETTAFITRRLAAGTFAAGIQARADRRKISSTVLHSRSSRLSVEGSCSGMINFVAAVTAPMSDSPSGVLRRDLNRAEASAATLWESHREKWRAFWLRSLMECGDDYLDNLWHLTMYYANASQRGRSPGRFINGLWGWNRDFQPWNYYFHWNQQQIYWPLNAAGHHDLLTSYLDYRFDSLSQARAAARCIFNCDGAFVSDVADRRGNSSICENRNHTPVAQIAMDFWRQYKFTGDTEFLKDKAWPYILEAARFFVSRFELRDGRYHTRMGTGYEGWIELEDVISELVSGKVLFQAALEAAGIIGGEVPDAEKWRMILRDMAALPMVVGEAFIDAENRHGIGCFKGDPALGTEILAAGYGLKEQRWLTSIVPSQPRKKALNDVNDVVHWLENVVPDDFATSETTCYHGIFPNVEYSAVFPSGLIGLGQRGTPEYDAAVNTVKAFSPDIMGWDPLPIVLARLGLAAEFWKILADWPDHWQYYCNGFGHYGPHSAMRRDAVARFRTMLVRDFERRDQPGNLPLSAWPFRHMGMESMSVLATAMNEAMLQSHDGIIRVASVATKGRFARFTLHAQGGFVVSAEVSDGKPLWICVESRIGGCCRLANPWTEASIRRNGRLVLTGNEAIIEIRTAPGERLVFTPAEESDIGGEVEVIEHPANAAPKSGGHLAVLGLRGIK